MWVGNKCSWTSKGKVTVSKSPPQCFRLLCTVPLYLELLSITYLISDAVFPTIAMLVRNVLFETYGSHIYNR